jgi:hypothetical protein
MLLERPQALGAEQLPSARPVLSPLDLGLRQTIR